MRLRLRVRPKPGEDAVDQALRLAHRNGYSRLAPFLSVHGIRLTTASFERDVERIAELSGNPLEPTREWTLSQVGRRNVDFRGVSLPTGPLMPKYRRYCPRCLDEDFRNAPADEPTESAAYLRSWWGISVLYACSVHRCAMCDHCPQCGSRIPTELIPLYRCHCGFELRNAVSETLAAHELTANNYLLGRFGIGERMESPMLDSVPVWQVANVLRRLGAAALLGKRDTVKIAVGKLDQDIAYDQPPAALGRLLSAGFAYARDGSASLLRLMEKMAEGDRRLYSGPSELLGEKFRAWAVHKDNPIRDTILEVWDPFVARHCRPTRRTNPTQGARPAHLATKPQILHPLEQARFEATLGRSLPPSTTRADALTIGKAEGLLLSKAEVKRLTGLRVRQLSKLVAACLIRPIWYSDVPHSEPYYSGEVSALLESLSALSLGEPPSKGRTLLRSALIKGGEIAVPLLFSRILRGDLEIFGTSGDNLWTSFYIASRGAPKGRISGLDRMETGSILGVDSDTVDRLVLLGHLTETSHEEGSLIDVNTIEEFDRGHITAARLGHICSSAMAANAIEEWLIGLSVSPILPTGYQAMFPRDAAIRAFYQNWSWDLEPPGARPDIPFASAADAVRGDVECLQPVRSPSRR